MSVVRKSCGNAWDLVGVLLLRRQRQPAARHAPDAACREKEPKPTLKELADAADPDTARLLRDFPETLGAWGVGELVGMGAVEIIERAYGEDRKTGIAM